MFKYCPNCKSDQLSFENQHFWQCPECHFLYYHNTASAVAGIIVCNNKMLLTTRAKDPKKGLLDLPGGFIDRNESLEQGLSREVKEELNLEIEESAWQYFCSFPNEYHYKDIDYFTCDNIFICHLEKQPELKAEECEIAAITWVDIDTLNPDDIAFKSLQKAVKQFIKVQKLS